VLEGHFALVLFLLVSIASKAFLSFMRLDLMPFSFSSARHVFSSFSTRLIYYFIERVFDYPLGARALQLGYNLFHNLFVDNRINVEPIFP